MLSRLGLRVVAIRSLFARAPVSFIYKDKNVQIESPKYGKEGGNIVSNTLDYIHNVDETRKKIDSIPAQVKTNVLLSRIEDNQELLFFVALFHHELQKVGITPSTTASVRSTLLWKYRLQYLISLRKIHGIFFEQCKLLAITEHSHRLGFSPDNIGILDPANFAPEVYEELQSGLYKGTDFRSMEMVGSNPFRAGK